MERGPYRSYSYEFKAAVIAPGNARGVHNQYVPRSTKHYWRHHGIGCAPKFEHAYDDTEVDSAQLAFESRLEVQRCAARALCAAVIELARTGTFKDEELAAVWSELRWSLGEDVVLELKELLPRGLLSKITGPICEKSDDGRCLKRHPHRIAATEIEEMRRLVVSKRHAHFSISSLCLYAKRRGLVSCNRDTWYRYIHKFGWQRPLRKRKVKAVRCGLRATKPNEIWHIDATHIKLSDGVRLFLTVLIDNYSRRVLAWELASALNAALTVKLIKKSKKIVRQRAVNLVTDGGTENVNSKVRDVIATVKPRIVHKIAQVEIRSSNSMAETTFHQLKNRHLYSQQLDTRRDAKRHIKFYFKEHDEVIPQAALSGLTPKEAHEGAKPEALIAELAQRARKMRQARLEHNRINVCGPCKQQRSKSEEALTEIEAAS